MATLKEVEKQLRESKKKNREKDKIIEEHETHIKFLHDRLKLAKDDLFDERQKRLNMTIDDVMVLVKARAEFEEKQKKDKQIVETFENQIKQSEKLKENAL
jgi:hypothetical protein